MASRHISTGYIVQDEGICGGKPRIEGTRMKVQHIALEYVHMGLSVDEICKSHPHLDRAQIHAALSHYYEHAVEIEGDIKDDEEFAKRMEAEQR